ncbi:MAG: PIG-L family deacetylase [bacterium]
MNPKSQPLGIPRIRAHPDDESFGNPATITLYAGRGVPMSMATLTRGEAGETNGVCAPEELGRVRDAELRAACRILGVGQLEIWRYPDVRLNCADEEEAVSRLLSLYEKTAAEVIVTYGGDGLTGHLDHMTASRWATEAFFRLRRKGAPPPRAFTGGPCPKSGAPISAAPTSSTATTTPPSSTPANSKASAPAPKPATAPSAPTRNILARTPPKWERSTTT